MIWPFSWLSSLWRKIVWVAKVIYTFVSPIYGDVVAIIKQVKEEGLENEEAKKAVFDRIQLILQKKGIKIPDSVLNGIIEVVYYLVKNNKD